MNKPRFMIGRIPPTPGLVDHFFNTSTGQGEDGEIDARGPWNQGEDLELVEAPAFQALAAAQESIAGENGVDDQLRDLLSAEGQLVKALAKMVKAARAESLKFALAAGPRADVRVAHRHGQGAEADACDGASRPGGVAVAAPSSSASRYLRRCCW